MWGLSCSMWGFHCGTWGSFTAAHALSVAACSLSHSTAQGILVPRPGTEPASPALQGGFLTIGPPGKFQYFPSCGFKTTHFLPSHPSPVPFIAHLEDQGILLTGTLITPLTFQKTLQRIFAKCNLKQSGGRQKTKFS